MGEYDYAGFFKGIRGMEMLQVAPGDITWVERYTDPDRAYDLVLYLGCNIFRTPHLARQVVTVFEHLGFDFIAVGGQQFCCGIPWERAGDLRPGDRVSSRTIARMESYNPQAVVMWCPSCGVHFDQAVLGRQDQHPAFEITDAPAFLAQLAAEGKLPWRRTLNRKVLLHVHQGAVHMPSGQKRAASDRRAVSALLDALPGIDVVDVVVAPESLSYHCGSAESQHPDFQSHAEDVRQRAAAAGADAIVTISHACQRSWGPFATEDVAVMNYITLIAAALDCPVYADSLQALSRMPDADTAVEQTRDIWSSHGLTADEARRIAAKQLL